MLILEYTEVLNISQNGPVIQIGRFLDETGRPGGPGRRRYPDPPSAEFVSDNGWIVLVSQNSGLDALLAAHTWAASRRPLRHSWLERAVRVARATRGVLVVPRPRRAGGGTLLGRQARFTAGRGWRERARGDSESGTGYA